MTLCPEMRAVAHEFLIGGDFLSAERFGSGHIHETYVVTFVQAGRPVRYLIQRFNDRVFKDPVAVMENIVRVTAHLRAKYADWPDRDRRVPVVLETRDGAPIHRNERGGWWRGYRFIERTRSYDAVQSTAQAYEAAKAFGRFQGLLADLRAPRLHETIRDFHHTPKRFAALVAAIEADPENRAAGAGREIEFALRREGVTGALVGANLPERVIHNDTKLNNVLLDEDTGEAICVIDLDTVMPGLAPYDFGDLVRTTTSSAAEDERDLSKVRMELPMFEALLRGYLDSAGAFLTKAEQELLAAAGRVITFENGMRFLTDHLLGDTYYKIHWEDQNLDRCRTQFRLVESMEAQEDAMERLVESLSQT